MCISMLICLSLFLSELQVGVVDRIEGEQVVILVEEVQEEIVIEKEQLGVFARKDNWLLLRPNSLDPLVLKALPNLEKDNRKKAQDLLEELRKKR